MITTQAERDRAWRLGALAAKAGRGLGGACPYKPKQGDARSRVLALVFVRGYVANGGTVDGTDYGSGKAARPASTRTRATSSGEAAAHRKTSTFGHLGYPA